MIDQLNNWYNKLTPLTQLLVSFLLNWIFWLAAWLIGERMFFDEKMSWSYHIFHATWMALFMTIPFNLGKIKALFEKRKPQFPNQRETP